MLVLARQKDQSVVVRDSRTGELVLTVMVTEIRGEKVRLGFDAPPHFRIDREEVDAIRQADPSKAITAPADPGDIEDRLGPIGGGVRVGPPEVSR